VIDVVETARRIGEELLFPRALETDAAALVPVDNLDPGSQLVGEAESVRDAQGRALEALR